MTYAYLLAGENLELAEAELKGFLSSQEIEEDPKREERLALTKKEPSQIKRLALTHEVSKVIERSKKLETEYEPENSFAVRAEDLTGEKNTKEVEKNLGSEIKTKKNSVDLENPEEVIKVYILEDEYVIGRQILEIDRSLFNQRKNQNREFSSPVSLDPVLARVLVNLSEVSTGEKLLDPFCGTGGILLEAGLCSIDVYGLDIQVSMVEGTKKNLEDYGILNHDIREGSINQVEDIFDLEFDAVVTDVPYGKASKKDGKTLEKFLESAPKLTEGKIIFMSDKENLDGMSPEFDIYVHKNLTRYIYILQ
ncbi:MAG: methyltransferase domain-containing protein [Nanohaloarchaea archaeon]|nr:methyltransferase domain-containing protein [Candidatus Nanohaloarchaea archaeon]